MSCMAHGKKLCDNGTQKRYVNREVDGKVVLSEECVPCILCRPEDWSRWAKQIPVKRNGQNEPSGQVKQGVMFDGRKDAYSE